MKTADADRAKAHAASNLPRGRKCEKCGFGLGTRERVVPNPEGRGYVHAECPPDSEAG